MITLVRKGKDVYFNDIKLTRVDQASKGAGNEVIKIEGLPGSNGAKWISLSKLSEGKNEVEVSGRKVTTTGSYTLTPEEKAEVDKLQARIDEIKEAARSRFVKKPKFLSSTEIKALSKEAHETYTQEVEKYLESLRNGATM